MAEITGEDQEDRSIVNMKQEDAQHTAKVRLSLWLLPSDKTKKVQTEVRIQPEY